MSSIVLSETSVPSVKMLSALDPVDLKLQFEALAGSVFPANQPPSELRLSGPHPCLGLRVGSSYFFLELFM